MKFGTYVDKLWISVFNCFYFQVVLQTANDYITLRNLSMLTYVVTLYYIINIHPYGATYLGYGMHFTENHENQQKRMLQRCEAGTGPGNEATHTACIRTLRRYCTCALTFDPHPLN